MLFRLLKRSQLIMFDRLIWAGWSSEDVNVCVSSGGFLTSSASGVSFASIVGWSRGHSSEKQRKDSPFHQIELSTNSIPVIPREGKSGIYVTRAMSPILLSCQLTNLVHSVSDVLFLRLFISNPAKYGSGFYPINNWINLLCKQVNNCRHKSC